MNNSNKTDYDILLNLLDKSKEYTIDTCNEYEISISKTIELLGDAITFHFDNKGNLF